MKFITEKKTYQRKNLASLISSENTYNHVLISTIKKLEYGVVFVFATHPKDKETSNNYLLGNFIGFSPLRGSHRAAPIACVCGWTEVSLYL